MNNTKQVTVNISEEAYRSLEAIAKAMNSVGWCEDDNTVESVLEEFCLNCEDTEEVKENIIYAIDPNTNSEKEASERIGMLREAFDNI